MADILQGSVNHKQHAPLSYGQTLAVCKHLEEQNLTALREIKQLRLDLNQTNGGCDALRNDFKGVQAMVFAVRQMLSDTNANADAANQSAKQNRDSIEKMRMALGQARENVGSLREGQKITNTNVQSVREELKEHKEDYKQVLKVLDEVGLGGDGRGLKDHEHDQEVRLQRLCASCEDLKHGAEKQKAQFCAMEAEMNKEKENLGVTKLALKEKIKVLESVSLDLKGTKENMELTNAVVMKIHDDHESSKAQVEGLQQDMQTVGHKVQKVHDHSIETTKNLAETRGELAKVNAHHDKTRNVLTQACQKVQTLQEGHNQSSANLNAIAGGLERVHGMAKVVSDSLQETNAYVLPNLHYDTVGPLKPPGAPMASPRRKPKDSKWIQRNIGNAPNRMDWA